MSNTPTVTFRPATEETPVVRGLLIGLAVLGIASLVAAPLLVVFAEALAKGWLAAVKSLGNREVIGPIELPGARVVLHCRRHGPCFVFLD